MNLCVLFVLVKVHRDLFPKVAIESSDFKLVKELTANLLSVNDFGDCLINRVVIVSSSIVVSNPLYNILIVSELAVFSNLELIFDLCCERFVFEELGDCVLFINVDSLFFEVENCLNCSEFPAWELMADVCASIAY